MKIQIDNMQSHGPQFSNWQEERRRKPRISGPFSARVRGINASGEPFDIGTFIESFSASGLYLRIPQRIENGAKMFIVTRLSITTDEEMPAPRVALHAVGVRIEPQTGDLSGVAAKILHHRFLWQKD